MIVHSFILEHLFSLYCESDSSSKSFQTNLKMVFNLSWNRFWNKRKENKQEKKTSPSIFGREAQPSLPPAQPTAPPSFLGWQPGPVLSLTATLGPHASDTSFPSVFFLASCTGRTPLRKSNPLGPDSCGIRRVGASRAALISSALSLYALFLFSRRWKP